MPVFPILIAVVVVVAVVICLCLVVVVRSRRDDEGDRFRHVADLTSAWSRERPTAKPSGSANADGANATESVDSR